MAGQFDIGSRVQAVCKQWTNLEDGATEKFLRISRIRKGYLLGFPAIVVTKFSRIPRMEKLDSLWHH